jgi:hypothetical protein
VDCRGVASVADRFPITLMVSPRAPMMAEAFAAEFRRPVVFSGIGCNYPAKGSNYRQS